MTDIRTGTPLVQNYRVFVKTLKWWLFNRRPLPFGQHPARLLYSRFFRLGNAQIKLCSSTE